MAESSGFFRSVGGDRKYTVDFLAKWVAGFLSSGVYKEDLAVSAGENMEIIIPSGQAWINGYYYRNDAGIALSIQNADGVLNRRDTVVLRWDVNERSITARILTGTPASEPNAPELVRGAEQYDLKLAEISIPAGTTAITQDLITDTRLDTDACGIVHAVVDHIDTTTFYDQIQAELSKFKNDSEADFTEWSDGQKQEFEDFTSHSESSYNSWSDDQKQSFEVWLESVKDALNDNAAGNLLSLINNHKEDTTVHITEEERKKWNVNSVRTCMQEKTTSFLRDNSIQEDLGDTIQITHFLSSGDIEEVVTRKANDKLLLKKTTKFLANGEIREVVAENELG